MGAVGETFGGFSGLKFRLLMLALFAVAAGLVWNLVRDPGQDGAVSVSRENSTSLRSYWASGLSTPEKVANQVDSWGDASVRLGGAFIVAMLFGSLLRVFFKTMFTLTVIVLGVMIFLDYRDVIDPPWSDYLGSLEEMKGQVLAQTESVKAFLKGHFPPTASALVGFGFGLKR